MPLKNSSRPIALVINTRSRRGQAEYDAAVEAVRRAGVGVKAHSVSEKTDTERILRDEIEAGAHVVIVGGGDGTLSMCAGILAGTQTALGVLPMGTGNTLARSLGIPLELDAAAKVLAGGHIEAMDVGRVNGTVFVNSVTLGLSSDIAGGLDKNTKQRLGLLSWPVVGAAVLWRHKAMTLELEAAEKHLHVRTHQLVVGSGRYVAGPVAAAPDASVQSHRLNVFVLGGSRFGSLARTTWQWISGRHVQAPAAHYFETAAVRITSEGGPLPADVDGEISQQTPLDIRIEPGALRVVVPPHFDAENPKN